MGVLFISSHIIYYPIVKYDTADLRTNLFLMSFKKLVMEILVQVEFTGLQPLACNAEKSIVADVRIMLKS